MEVDEEEDASVTPSPPPSHVVGLRSRSEKTAAVGGDAGEGGGGAGVRVEGGVTPELRGSQGSEAEELLHLRSKGLRGGGGGHEGGGGGGDRSRGGGRRVEHQQRSSWLREAEDEVRVPGGLRGGGEGGGGQVRQGWIDAAEGR